MSLRVKAASSFEFVASPGHIDMLEDKIAEAEIYIDSARDAALIRSAQNKIAELQADVIIAHVILKFKGGIQWQEF
ncbi:MAG: hypothetical protein WBP26_02815 [Candidatus Saccharimonadales bacterium]